MRLDDGVAWRRRHRQRQRLQATHRAGAVGVEVIEEHALANQRVEIRRDVALAAEFLEEVGRQALHADQHHIEVLLRAGVADLAGEIARIVADVRGLGCLDQLAHALERFVVRQRAVEARVVEVAAAEGREKLVDAVAGQLVDVVVVGAVLIGALERHRRDHRDQQPHQHHLAALQEACAGIAGAQAATADPYDHQRGQGQQAEPGAQRIRLANVADHLGGVDQVIHRDEVEARAELAPEHQFRSADEHQPKQQDRSEGIERPLARTRHVGARRHQPQKQHQRPGDVTENDQVIKQAHAKRVRPVQRIVRHAAASHEQQRDARDCPDQYVTDGQPPQRTKALAQR